MGRMLAIAVFFGLIVGTAWAQNGNRQGDGNRQGVVKAVDPVGKTITIAADGKDERLQINDQTRLLGAAGATVAEQLQSIPVGSTVAFRLNRDGTLFGVKMGAGTAAGGKPNRGASQLPPPTDVTKLVPLTDMGAGKYQGYDGGLYPKGSNRRPERHEAAGIALANGIQPLDAAGKPSVDGKIVLLGVGMSNTTMEFTAFKKLAAADPRKNPNVVLVDGAQSGQTAFKTQDPSDNGTGTRYWNKIEDRIKEAGATANQVQVAWFKQADAYPTESFPKHAEIFRDEMRRIMQNMHTLYPNLKIVYLSSRTFGGYAKTQLNPEPYAFEEGLAVKWLIEGQIAGEAALNFDPDHGTVRAPWLSWGPYLWTRGTTKRSDGMSFSEEDFRENDRTHPSSSGQEKVATMLLTFLKSDPTATPWFLRR